MGITERKQFEKNARRKLILDSAAVEFRQNGFSSATIKDIAERAQIANSTIYLYFKSKADLYFSLVKPALENLNRRFKSIANKKSERPDVRIKNLMHAVYDFYLYDRDAYNLVTRYNASEYENLLPKESLKIYRQMMRSNLKQLEVIIDEGIRMGLFKKKSAFSGSVIFWSAFMGIVQFQESRMMPGKRDYKKETLDEFIETMLDGMRKK